MRWKFFFSRFCHHLVVVFLIIDRRKSMANKWHKLDQFNDTKSIRFASFWTNVTSNTRFYIRSAIGLHFFVPHEFLLTHFFLSDFFSSVAFFNNFVSVFFLFKNFFLDFNCQRQSEFGAKIFQSYIWLSITSTARSFDFFAMEADIFNTLLFISTLKCRLFQFFSSARSPDNFVSHTIDMLLNKKMNTKERKSVNKWNQNE